MTGGEPLNARVFSCEGQVRWGYRLGSTCGGAGLVGGVWDIAGMLHSSTATVAVQSRLPITGRGGRQLEGVVLVLGNASKFVTLKCTNNTGC